MMKAYFLAFVAFLTACSPLSVELPENVDYLDSVEAYLVKNIGITSFDGQVFCSFEVLDAKQQNPQVDVSVWALCQEYYLLDHFLEEGTGSSLPVALHLQKIGSEYRLQSYEIPKDGMGYGPSIQALFSPLAIERMCEEDPDCYNGRVQRLQRENEQKARAFYNIN